MIYFSASTTFSQKTFPICRNGTMWMLPPLQGDNDVDGGDYHGDGRRPFMLTLVHAFREIFTCQFISFWQLNISA